jgi:RimJ/RimL family protein N-acetyltransferase
MLEHAFTRLNLHRVSLSVFSFNERAIRAYRKAGFVAEGRAREAIWRDGRFWDEITMSVLDREWQALQRGMRPLRDDEVPMPAPDLPAPLSAR